MARTVRRAAPPCLLLCLAAGHALAAQAGPSGPPTTMQGFIRYQVRGLSAVQGGLLSGGIMSVATGVGMQAALMNTLRLVSGMAKVSGQPTTGEVETFLRTGKGFDFSGAPVSAGEGIDLNFVLENDGRGNWRLKSGTARYSGKTDAEFSHQNADGFVKITDRYSGDASVQLTPENASITLTTTGSGQDRRVEFDVAVAFPVAAVGKSRLTTNVYEIFFEDNGHVFKSGLNFLGQQHSDQSPSTPISPGINYSRSGPLDSVLRGRETWQDLRDSGVMIEWELWDECSARIETPKYFDELVYDNSTTGRIERRSKADVQPTFWDQDLHWTFMPMSGSDIQPTPDQANGNDFDLTYTKLPPKNSSFGHWELKAEFVTDRARKAGCRNPDPHQISYHFTREADNNPGPASKPPDGPSKFPDANWFYYWGQTAAAQGRRSELRYGGDARYCSEQVDTTTTTENGIEITTVRASKDALYGYAPYGWRHVVICDLSKLDFADRHKFTGRPVDGIDTYAVTVLHELKHHDDFEKWWPMGHSDVLDNDGDLIPDLLESSVKVPPPLNGTHKVFDPNEFDTLKRGMGDEHILAYMAEMEWKPGKSDHEDWACPGHQASDECGK